MITPYHCCSGSTRVQGPSPDLAPNANITHRVCLRPSLSSIYSLANGAGGTIVGLICSQGRYCNTSTLNYLISRLLVPLTILIATLAAYNFLNIIRNPS